MIDRSVVDELIESIVTIDGRDPVAPRPPAFLDENLLYFLSKCNGGYTRDHYFHFFGNTGNTGIGIEAWNSAELWKRFYGNLVLDLYFFAEDIFGNQFGYKNDGNHEIFLLWVDDGRLDIFANSFEEFTDYTVFGFEVFRRMRELSERFLSLPGKEFMPYKHLSYKKPLLLGGHAADVNNLELCESVANLRILGQLVTQCKALPKGTKVTNVKIDYNSQTILLVPE